MSTSTRPIITVEVTSDRVDSGKTAIAAIIQEALKEHGFTDVDVQCQDGDIYKFADPEALAQALPMIHKRNPRVEIQDNNRRVPKSTPLRDQGLSCSSLDEAGTFHLGS